MALCAAERSSAQRHDAKSSIVIVFMVPSGKTEGTLIEFSGWPPSPQIKEQVLALIDFFRDRNISQQQAITILRHTLASLIIEHSADLNDAEVGVAVFASSIMPILNDFYKHQTSQPASSGHTLH